MADITNSMAFHHHHHHRRHHQQQNAEQTIFDHIESRDIEGMILLFATAAMDGMVSYASLRRRWMRFEGSGSKSNKSSGTTAPYFSRNGSDSEEKIDEYFQAQRHYHPSLFRYLPPHHQGNNGNGQQGEASSFAPGGPSSSRDNNEQAQSPNDILREIDAIIRDVRSAREAIEKEEADGSTPKRREVDDSRDGFVMNDDASQQHHQQPFKKTKQSASASLTSNQSYGNSSSSTTTSSQNTDVANEELERIVRDAAAVLSNARPSSSFIVYDRDNSRRRRGSEEDIGKSSSNGKATAVADHEENHNDEEDEDHQHGPPLFDGSVANATPGHAAGGGGGSGTALHLCCAIDSPFALAVLLAMGGDASSRHTAFRRLIVHEAACADSPSCLRLLLELGDEFGPGMFPERSSENEQNNTNSGKDEARQRTPSLPIHSFFSGWGKSRNNAATSTTLSSSQPGGRICGRSLNAATVSSSAIHRQFRATASVSSLSSSLKDRAFAATPIASTSSQKTKEEHTLSFVATLRLALDLARSIRSGSTSEIDAARRLLSAVSLPDPSKIAIASSCYVAPTPGDQEIATASSAIPAFSSSSRNLSARSPSVSSAPAFFSPLPTTVPQPNANADGHGNTPLHWASFKNAADCVSVLLAHRANPSAQAHPSGWTPLHDAAYSDAHLAVSLLLEAGADVDVRANSGATPLCFAAQEDAPGAAELLLRAGADPTVRCCGHSGTSSSSGGGGHTAVAAHHHHHASRFSGYTPLHYCAHYNAARAAHVLLEKSKAAKSLLEVPDLNDKFPIHVAVARGSSDVLRELLHGGARVDTAPSTALSEEEGSESGGQDGGLNTDDMAVPPSPSGNGGIDNITTGVASVPVAILDTAPSTPVSQQPPAVVTPVSSPVLRQLIPSRPITSSKPWNCLSQKSIDECRNLISEAEMHWTPDRHTLFSPTDRRAVLEVLRVGKRLEQMGTGIFLELWPCVLSFCGRGWFEIEESTNGMAHGDDDDGNRKPPSLPLGQRRDRTESSSLGEAMEFTQFHLDR